MDDIIKISNINDFIFCPASIYFHNLYGNENKLMFQSKYQLNGTKAHETVDENKYSTKAEIITALDVYSEQYRIIGKLIFLTRKRNYWSKEKSILKKYMTDIFFNFMRSIIV